MNTGTAGPFTLSRGATPTGGVGTGQTFSTSYAVANAMTEVGILTSVTLRNPTSDNWIPQNVTVEVAGHGAYEGAWTSGDVDASGGHHETAVVNMTRLQGIFYHTTITTASGDSSAWCSAPCTLNDLAVTFIGEGGREDGPFSLALGTDAKGGVTKETALKGGIFDADFAATRGVDLGKVTSVNLTNPTHNGWKVAKVCVHVHAAVHYDHMCGVYGGWIENEGKPGHPSSKVGSIERMGDGVTFTPGPIHPRSTRERLRD